MNDLSHRDTGVDQAIDAAKGFGLGADELGQRSELAQQRFGIAAWDRLR